MKQQQTPIQPHTSFLDLLINNTNSNEEAAEGIISQFSDDLENLRNNMAAPSIVTPEPSLAPLGAQPNLYLVQHCTSTHPPASSFFTDWYLDLQDIVAPIMTSPPTSSTDISL